MATEEKYKDILEVPRYQDYKPAALLLTNVSGKGLVALSIRWVAMSGTGSKIFDLSSDSLLSRPSGGGVSMGMPMRVETSRNVVRLGDTS